jgi:nitrite reductase/ring-hydroxylating ferredoxin subunit
VKPRLKEHQFFLDELAPGHTRLVFLDRESVAVYNVDGTLYATQDACTHLGGQLSEGTLAGSTITCPLHGSCFDVTSGEVSRGPAKMPLKTYKVVKRGKIAWVEQNPG